MWHSGKLTDDQALLVESFLSSPSLVKDHSWGLVDTVVLHVASHSGDAIVKAGGTSNHHLEREISAHEGYTAPLLAVGGAAKLIGASRDANVLVTEYLPGHLVEGAAAEFEPDTYVQAGRLLRRFHDQAASSDSDFERAMTEGILAWLDTDHRIAPAAERAARRILTDYRPEPVTVVPTHGDWQPRNWLVHDGSVTVIDYGRFGFRPAASDLCRLAAQQWREDPELEAAFLRGYGADPRDPTLWPMLQLREALGVAVWAYQVGAKEFEAQGHRMLDEALLAF